MSRRTPFRRRLGIGLATGAVVLSSAVAATLGGEPAGAAVASHVVVVSGLNNPRQLQFLKGKLLIAEAGRGGTLQTMTSPEGGKQGIGFTGSISLVYHPKVAANRRPNRIIRGLLSAAAATASNNGPVGSGAVGSDGVAARVFSRIFVQETFIPGLKLPKNTRRPFNGKLALIEPGGSRSAFADITAFERRNDPDGYGFDSDPYAVIPYRGGWLVADAAGNDVLHVGFNGAVSVFHVFPNRTADGCANQFDPHPPFKGCNFVPTSMATDAQGNVYVGGLTGLQPGLAQLVKLNPQGRFVRVWRMFTAITGVAVAKDGSIYVSQLFADPLNKNDKFPGRVTHIVGNKRTAVDVPLPAGLALDDQGNLYVAAFSTMPASGSGAPGGDTSGQVWRMKF